MIDHMRGSAAVCALLASTALSAPALAQTTPAPSFVNVDANGVDLTTGLVSFSLDEGGIGSGEGAVRMQRIWAEGAGWLDNWSGGLYRFTSGGVIKAYVQIGGISDTFTALGSAWTSDKADGATLTVVSGYYYYTARDGTKFKFDTERNDGSGNNTNFNCPGADPTTCQAPLSITKPNGNTYTLTWTKALLCLDLPGEPCAQVFIYKRLATVTSSAGYKLTVAYATDNKGSGTEPPVDWFKRTSVTFTNLAGAPSPLPVVTYAYPTSTTTDVTDPGGRTWKLTTASGKLSGIRRPGSAADNITYAYGGSGLVSTATRDGVTTSYSRTVAGNTGTMTVTNALSQQSVVISDLTKGRPTSFKDALVPPRITSFQYDANSRLTRTTAPEGNYVELTYDARGNVTQSKAVAKAGSGLTDIIASASYDATCTNVVKCNKPNTTADPRSNVTNYEYDPTHGGVTVITRPAPTVGAVRPETRVAYTAVAGAGGQSVHMPTKVSACQMLTSCADAADETRTTATYNSNLLPTTVVNRNGSGTLIATSTLAYDPRGNMLTLDGPLAGTADTTRFVYDAIDRRIGTISPDPDGGGMLLNRAVRTTFRPDGQVDKVERGTTDGQSDAAFTAFISKETQQLGYDANNRPTTQRLIASGTGTTYALTQMSYDLVGRPECSAVRMNPAVFGSLPASACTLGTEGTNGKDRITKAIYDAAGQVTQQLVAVGTADQAAEATATYTNDGRLATLTDAEVNKTTYEYDGFDRLSKTRMPDTTKGSGTSSATDFEQLGYDASSNVTQRVNRAGQINNFTFDLLDRVKSKNLPFPEVNV